MSDDANTVYFSARARLERALALRSTSNIAAIRHFELAEYYDARAKGDAPPEPAINKRGAAEGDDPVRKMLDLGTFEPFIY